MKHKSMVLAILALTVLGLAWAQGNTQVDVESDPVTGDSVRVRIPMASSDSTGTPMDRDSVLLTFRCDNDGLDIFLLADNIQTFYGYPARIIYRFSGGEPSTTRNWNASTSGYSVFLPMSREAEFFIAAQSAETVAVRWELDMGSNTFIYNLSEFQDRGLQPLRRCLGLD